MRKVSGHCERIKKDDATLRQSLFPRHAAVVFSLFHFPPLCISIANEATIDCLRCDFLKKGTFLFFVCTGIVNGRIVEAALLSSWYFFILPELMSRNHIYSIPCTVVGTVYSTSTTDVNVSSVYLKVIVKVASWGCTPGEPGINRQ